jgi:porin
VRWARQSPRARLATGGDARPEWRCENAVCFAYPCGTYSLYGLFQQMGYRDDAASSQKGLTVWGETAIAPKSSVSPMPYFVGGGVSYQGLIPGRDNDIAAAGGMDGRFSHAIPRTTAETVLEANDQITFNGWLSVSPDLQYIIRPSGSSAISNAFVLGVQLAMHF